VDVFDWSDLLKVAKDTNSDQINVSVRKLVSPGVILGNSKYNMSDLGRIVEERMEVDLIVGATKRFFADSNRCPAILAESLVDTRPLRLSDGMLGTGGVMDQTLPDLRKGVMSKKAVTKKTKRRKSQQPFKDDSKARKKDDINGTRAKQYEQLRSYGYDSKTANIMKDWRIDKIMSKLTEDRKI
jgi:hypothetical protein